MEEATRQHFFHHSEPGHIREKQNCHFCQIRAFATHARFPVTIVNTEDEAVLDPHFRFVEHSVLGKGVEPTRREFLTGCECVDGEDCQYSTCNCLQDVGDSSDEDENSDPTYAERGRKKTYAYHSHGAKAGRLRSGILTSRHPIYECHESCACGPDCPNRVVERGRKVPLQIFRTTNRGWGVRSTADIKKGQFVDKYMGEIITAEEANRRRAQSHIAQRKDVYLFALDKFSDPDSFDERLRGAPLEVDGEFMSGPTRFVNHSCEPNLRIFARVGDHADKHIHDLALFAVRDVPKGEELTFDYVDGIDDSEKDALDPEKRKDMTRCLAASPSARAINSPPPPLATPHQHPSGNGTDDSAPPSRGMTRSHLPSHSHSHRHHHHAPLSQHIDKPLRRHEWVARDRLWTRAQLDTERADFFDTRVTGRPEVWQVLHAALEVMWEADARRTTDVAPGTEIGGDDDGAGGLATAQSILKAAEVTLPTGDLSNGVYDSLGNYYALPEWIVSDPVNVPEERVGVQEHQEPKRKPKERHSHGDDDGTAGKDDEDMTDEEDTAGEELDEDEAIRRREEKGKAVADVRDMVKVRARLSDNLPDVIISVTPEESVRSVARKVIEESGLPSTKRVRIAYMGKILKENTSLQGQGWKNGHVVNALVFNR
ncbi:hypothetical protein GGS23DRAFT_597433 [Durotheca rogersii]|uniref:uncharacterized protein n=1 Tax=Durotheca rogersii TaxID=419775 RepID=UPI00221F1B5C|nr:uncharacterized protein GGS23DRAFT_597433 [Durotheca rogersii]KAI5862640.1 hypothetical protein GGS23DRAFT_597433 [Durotheca rogersii]